MMQSAEEAGDRPDCKRRTGCDRAHSRRSAVSGAAAADDSERSLTQSSVDRRQSTVASRQATVIRPRSAVDSHDIQAVKERFREVAFGHERKKRGTSDADDLYTAAVYLEPTKQLALRAGVEIRQVTQDDRASVRHYCQVAAA